MKFAILFSLTLTLNCLLFKEKLKHLKQDIDKSVTLVINKFDDERMFYYKTTGFTLKQNDYGVILIINLNNHVDTSDIENFAKDCHIKYEVKDKESFVIKLNQDNFNSNNLVGFSSNCQLKISYN